MERSAKAFRDNAKAAREFVAGIAAIIGLLYALGWLTDEILVRVHIRIDHRWWAYRVWHAWWWLVLKSGVKVGRFVQICRKIDIWSRHLCSSRSFFKGAA